MEAQTTLSGTQPTTQLETKTVSFRTIRSKFSQRLNIVLSLSWLNFRFNYNRSPSSFPATFVGAENSQSFSPRNSDTQRSFPATNDFFQSFWRNFGSQPLGWTWNIRGNFQTASVRCIMLSFKNLHLNEAIWSYFFISKDGKFLHNWHLCRLLTEVFMRSKLNEIRNKVKWVLISDSVVRTWQPHTLLRDWSEVSYTNRLAKLVRKCVNRLRFFVRLRESDANSYSMSKVSRRLTLWKTHHYVIIQRHWLIHYLQSWRGKSESNWNSRGLASCCSIHFISWLGTCEQWQSNFSVISPKKLFLNAENNQEVRRLANHHHDDDRCCFDRKTSNAYDLLYSLIIAHLRTKTLFQFPKLWEFYSSVF